MLTSSTCNSKSTEICQGFLLLCNWNQPSQRFEEERTCTRFPPSFFDPWLTLSSPSPRPIDQFSGIAIRMATDLNLHRKTIAVLPPDIGDETRVLYERELLNRERTWLYTFICDRSCVLPSFYILFPRTDESADGLVVGT